MYGEFKPGKGFQGPLTEDFIEWLFETVREVDAAFGRESLYIDTDDIEAELRQRLGFGSGWEYEEDSYGHRMVKTYAPDGDDSTSQVRVAAIIMHNGNTKLDIRTWFAAN